MILPSRRGRCGVLVPKCARDLLSRLGGGGRAGRRCRERTGNERGGSDGHQEGSGAMTVDLGYSVIDADNHYYEPRDAFTRYIDPKHRDLAIHVVTDDDGD